MVRIEFERDYNGLKFRDAITLPDDHGLLPKQIDDMQRERFENWIAIITAPPPEVVIEPEVVVDTGADATPVVE